jgi:ketosteroid isomerase-like protein
MRATSIIIGLLAAGLLAGCSRGGSEQTAEAARKDIVALQKQFREAVRAKNVDGVLALMTADFKQVDAKGKTLTKAQAGEEMKSSWPALRQIGAWSMGLDDFKVKGNTAEGRVHDRMMARVKQTDGVVRSVELDSVSRTVWERTAAGWRYKRMTEVKEDATAAADPMAKVDFVPVKEWAKESGRERDALLAKRRSEERAALKAAPKAAPGMTATQTRQMLTDLYAGYRRAIRAKDAAAALGYLTPDYSVEVPAGVIPRYEVEKALKQDFKRTKSVSNWDMTIQDVGMRDGALVVVLKETRTAVITDNNGRDRRVTSRDVMRDTWFKTDKGWKNSQTEILGGG